MKFELPNFAPNARVAILGVGSDLRGDDAAGVKAVEKMEERMDFPNLLLIIGGIVPESFTSRIKEFKPTHVLVIDAVDFEKKPGTISLVDPNKIVGQKISTHRLPLSMLIEYLRKDTEAEIALIGIQPASIDLGGTMSQPVKAAVDELVQRLKANLSQAFDH